MSDIHIIDNATGDPWNPGPYANTQMVLLDKNNKFICRPQTCKAYFQDIFYGEYRGSTRYPATWGPRSIEDLNDHYIRMGYVIGKDNISINNLKKLLNYFEDCLNIPHSKIIETANKNQVIIEFHRLWTKPGPPMISLFTLLLRLSPTYDGKDIEDFIFTKAIHETMNRSDAVTVSKRINEFKQIFNKKWKCPFTYHDVSSSMVHEAGFKSQEIVKHDPEKLRRNIYV